MTFFHNEIIFRIKELPAGKVGRLHQLEEQSEVLYYFLINSADFLINIADVLEIRVVKSTAFCQNSVKSTNL
jgi:hypothetical protein